MLKSNLVPTSLHRHLKNVIKIGCPYSRQWFLNTMKPHNFLEEEIRNVNSVITLVANNEVSHLAELIHYHHNSIISLVSLGGP